MSIAQDVSDFMAEVAVTAARYNEAPTLATAKAIRPLVAGYLGRIADLVESVEAFEAFAGADDYNAADIIRASVWVYDTRRSLYALRAALVDTLASVDAILRGIVPTRRHTVVSGDTLEQLAQRYLGDWSLWARLADHNRLEPGADLTAGTVLDLPDPVV